MYNEETVTTIQTYKKETDGFAKLLNYCFAFLRHPNNEEHSNSNFNNTKDYLFMHEKVSAKNHIHAETISLGIFTLLLTIFILYLLNILLSIPIILSISALVAIFYLSIVIFKLIVITKAIEKKPFIEISEKELSEIDTAHLPLISIIVPLYREEKVIPQIMNAMTSISYPTEKTEIIITLEEYDSETISAIEQIGIPKHFKLLILPNVKPKTKPKALNVAFNELKGDYVVIYDAEIIPEPTQLKKAYIAFKKNPDIACLQTRLDHYNAHQNIITKLFNAEFSFYYDLFLPGLQNLGFPIPLSGHSIFFRKSALREVGAWDPYNVTEDCDIGIRLFRAGHKVGILDSFSHEEATGGMRSWILQRARWMKGFVQTSIVHLRHPLLFKNEIGGWVNFISFLLTIPGTVLLNLINLFYLILLIGWFTTHSTIIQSFFPGIILYIAIASFILGNAIFIYLNLLGLYKRKRFSLVKYSLLSPLYWILLSVATLYGLMELITKPHHWQKTTHGKHMKGI